MGAFQQMRIILPLIALVVVAVIGLPWLEEYIYDRLWTREKILPQYAKVSAMDPEKREYLDPAILKAYAAREITIEKALELQNQQRA